MESGGWTIKKRSNSSNDSLSREYVAETGCLSIVVLGASGDLAKKKTFPALFNLYCQRFLNPDEGHIFGYARTKISDDELRNRIRGNLVPGKGASGEQLEEVSKFLQLIRYVSGSYDSEEGFRLLDKEISKHEFSKNTKEGSSRRLFYLALPTIGISVCLQNDQELLHEQIWYFVLQIAFSCHWNCDNIDNVQIVFREDFGTKGRGGYFDEYGLFA